MTQPPGQSATQDDRRAFDIVVVGAGVVGCAIARELARYELSVALVEAGSDVGAGTSKANTAILHTGFDATPGTLESRLLRRSYPLMVKHARETGIALEHTGALLVAWTSEQEKSLPALREKTIANGVDPPELLDPSELYSAEPHLGPGALAALRIAGESILCPYSPPIAFARQAITNGVELMLESPVRAVAQLDACGPDESAHLIIAGSTQLQARWVINAAGLHSDEIDHMLGFHRFRVSPRRGELIVFDKAANSLLRHILLPVPTPTTKGVLVSPTVFGNVLLGPTAEDLDDKQATGTTRVGLTSLLQKGRQILPALLDEEITATYAGLRAATESSDYQIHVDPELSYVCVGGIRSTGLSAALGIAEYVVEQLNACGLALPRKQKYNSVIMPPIGELQARPYLDAAAIAANPDCGEIVCHCERVTKAELLEATRGVLPARSLDGLRRRTRCLQGRCQGFHCLANIVALLAEATGRPTDQLLMLDRGWSRGRI